MAGGRARVRRDWSDLPDDIIDTVYRGCCSSPYDRIRFAAVCSSWRAVASWHPKMPALPLLLPSTGDSKRDRRARAYILEEGRALRAPLQGFPWGQRLVGSYDGGWVAAATFARLQILNVFSGARVTLGASNICCNCPTARQALNPRSTTSPGETYIKKVIFSEDPSSSGCILVAMTTRCKMALYRIGCPSGGWTTGGCGDNLYNDLADVAFYNGELYGLTHSQLFKFEIGMNGNDAPVVTLVQRIHIELGNHSVGRLKAYGKYVFELRGKLAIAIMYSSWAYCCSAQFVKVFELSQDTYKWIEVTSLDDHALFLGPACCKAVHVPVTSERSKVERNNIYYFQQHLCDHHDTKCLKELELGSYNIYYGKNVGVSSSQKIMSWRYHYEDSSDGCIWLVPPDL